MNDFPAYLKATAETAPTVLAIVLALVRLWGKLGATGKVQLLSSLATGLVIGTGFQIAVLGVPKTYAEWFMAVVYGLGVGALASGVYEVGKELLVKVVSSTLGIQSNKLGKG